MPEEMTSKEEFIAHLVSTGRPGIEDLIKWLSSQTDFFESPASSRYHGSYRGGLVDHSLMVLDCALNLNEFVQNSFPAVPEIDETSIILVALLHDVCKANTYVESTRNVKNEKTGSWEKVPYFKRDPAFSMGHAGKSIYLVQRHIGLSPEEAQAIYWHMAAYDTSTYNTYNELGDAFTKNILAFLLSQADMMSTYILENEKYYK